MAKRPEELTIDSKKLLKLSSTDLVNMAKSQTGQSYLASLTPTQLAELFPDYFRKYLPTSIQKAISGGTPGTSGETSTGTETPSGGGATATPAPTTSPDIKKSPEVKESWQKKLERVGGDSGIPAITSSGPIKISKDGNIDPPSFYRSAVNQIRGSKLDGFIPKDGAKFGIVKGTPEEWARLYTMLTQQESGLRQAKVNSDGSLQRFDSTLSTEKSYGPGQFNIGEYGLNTWNDVNNPEKVISAYISQAEKYALKSGTIGGTGRGPGCSDGFCGLGAYFGSIRTPNKTIRHSKWFDTKIAPEIKRQEEESAKEQAKREATAVPEQNPNVTGGAGLMPSLTPDGPGPGQVQSQQIPGAVPPLPPGMSQGFMDHYNSLPQDKKDIVAKQVDNAIKKGYGVKEINADIESQSQQQNKTATPYQPNENFGKVNTAPDIKSLKELNLEEKFQQGEQRFFRDSGGTKGLNPKLIEVLKEASKDLPPGYHVRMFSGVDARSTGTKNHPGGVAVDLRIVDSKGKSLSDRGFGEGHKLYEQLAQSMKIRGQTMFPGTDYIWGGAWTAAGGDRMHYQIVDPDQLIRGASPGSGKYSFEKGVNPNLWAGPDAVKSFMSPEELQRYRQSIMEQIQKEKEQIKAKKTASPVAAQPTTIQQQPSQNVPSNQPAGRPLSITEYAGAVPQQPSQNVPEGQTGTTVPSSALTPGGPGPNNKPSEQAQSQPVPPPVQDRAQPETKQTEKKFKYGGRYQGENVTAVGPDGNVLFRANDKEKVSITPVNRTDPALLEQSVKERQIAQDNYTDQVNNQQYSGAPQQQTVSNQTNILQNPNLMDMYMNQTKNNMREVSNLSPSFERAMKNATSFGNSVDHFGEGSITTTIV